MIKNKVVEWFLEKTLFFGDLLEEWWKVDGEKSFREWAIKNHNQEFVDDP